ncbi:PREDICTED: uncharacterized protein LOC109179036 [Ipomoea nil]|uniref:uncharacterized protein LOC109179036 n=1 Tax=Ipomoea nil TaxID=35883 RepID=UPI00090123B5|nr:PREDICTED: uncharacterized protein LOC109179036 [Ipomoea nil]
MADEVLHLAVGRNTSKEVWDSITAALGSSTRARCLNLLGQLQSLRQGDLSPADYIGKAQLIVEALSLAGRPLSLDEQNLCLFRGLRPEFRSMVSSLTASGKPVSLPQLADFLQAQEFIYSGDIPVGLGSASNNSLAALHVNRGGNQSGGRSGGRRGNSGQGRGNRGGQWRGGGRGGGQPRCQICRAHGHSAIYCNKRYTTQPPQTNLTVTGDETASAAGSWFPDTGASAHATSDSSMLSQSSEYNGGDVLRVGNGSGFDHSGNPA